MLSPATSCSRHASTAGSAIQNRPSFCRVRFSASSTHHRVRRSCHDGLVQMRTGFLNVARRSARSWALRMLFETSSKWAAYSCRSRCRNSSAYPRRKASRFRRCRTGLTSQGPGDRVSLSTIMSRPPACRREPAALSPEMMWTHSSITGVCTRCLTRHRWVVDCGGGRQSRRLCSASTWDSPMLFVAQSCNRFAIFTASACLPSSNILALMAVVQPIRNLHGIRPVHQQGAHRRNV